MKCSVCGSSRTTRSPSGRHLICVDCQHIILREEAGRPARRQEAEALPGRPRGMEPSSEPSV